VTLPHAHIGCLDTFGEQMRARLLCQLGEAQPWVLRPIKVFVDIVCSASKSVVDVLQRGHSVVFLERAREAPEKRLCCERGRTSRTHDVRPTVEGRRAAILFTPDWCLLVR